MKFIRSTLVVAVTALVAAACGDKVTVPAAVTTTTVTTTAAPKVNSVTVTPSNATMNIGDVITMVAAVNADAGLATTVSWSSSDATKASVDATGKVTALAATPGVAICAASTVDAGKKGCGQVSVNAAGVTIPATVRIVSITAGNLNTPVNNAAVAGAVNVSLSVSPGTQTISKIALTLNGTEVDNQTFTATQAAALRGAADQAVATQSTFPTIVFFVNTAAFNAAGNGPQYKNGAYAVGANLYIKGGTTPSATATNATNVTFANVDGFVVSLVPNGTVAGGVVDGNGYRWYGNGTLTANLTPIMYSGLTVGTVNVALGGACGAVGGAGTAGSSMTAPYSVTLALTGSQSPAGCATTTPNIPIVSAADANGNAMTLVANGTLNVVLAGNATTGVRWDNVAPAQPTFFLNPNGRANGWINDAVSFNTLQTASTNGWLTAAVADAGVGLGVAGTGISYSVLIGSNAAGTVAAAKAGSAATSAAALAQTATATAGYCAIARATDALGNITALPASATVCAVANGAAQIAFGVDRVAPILTNDGQAGYTKSLRKFTTATPTQIGFILSDTSINAAAANITVKGAAVRAGGTAASDTVVISATVAPPTTTQTTAPGAIAAGYWTVSATASDQAGNSMSITPYIFLYDATAAAASNPLQTNAGLTAGNAESFFATATDNVDLDSAYVVHTLTDPNANAWPFILSATKLQTAPFLAGAQVKSAAISGAWPTFPRGIDTVTTGAAISAGSGTVAVSAGTAAVSFWSTDQTNGGTGTLSTTANTAGSTTYTAVNLPAGAAWANSFTTAAITIANKRTTGTNGLAQGTLLGTNAFTSDTVTVTVTQTAQATPPASNPFSRAELWVRTNSGAPAGPAAAASRGFSLIGVGTPVVTYDGQAQIATWKYTFTYAPGTTAMQNVSNTWYAFLGYDSKFNAVILPSATGFSVVP